MTALAWLAALLALTAPARFLWCCCGPPDCTTNGCCTGLALPDTLTLTDSFWTTGSGLPSVTMTRAPGTCLWKGCLSGIPYSRGPDGCFTGAITIALHYTFNATTCKVTVEWAGQFHHDPSNGANYQCPIASDCSTATTGAVTTDDGGTYWTRTSLNCSPFSVSWRLDGGGSPFPDAETTPWWSATFGAAPTLTITL